MPFAPSNPMLGHCLLYCVEPRLTIHTDKSSPADPYALALAALGWVLADANRAGRLLSLTGLAPDDLRAGLGDPAMLGAVFDFLGAHEPDLVAAADALGVDPGELMHAKDRLEP